MLKSEIDVLDVLGGNSIANMTRRRSPDDKGTKCGQSKPVFGI